VRSKSLECIEIWQAIYETRGGLESFTRDPIGYEGGIGLYEFVGASVLVDVDPTGLKGGGITVIPRPSPGIRPGTRPPVLPRPPLQPRPRPMPPRNGPNIGPGIPQQPQIGGVNPSPQVKCQIDRRKPEDCIREFDDCMAFAEQVGKDCKPEHEDSLGMSCEDLVSSLQSSCQESWDNCGFGPKGKPPQSCKPCGPPAGTIGWKRIDNSGIAHFNKSPPQGPVPTPHTHVARMNQTPYPSCKCFWNGVDDVIPGNNISGMPNANNPPTGGGPY
jgi:hypothetical protein